MRIYAALALFVCLAGAARPSEASAQETESARADSVRERRLHLYPFTGLHFGGPVRASVSGGVGWRSLAPGEPVRAFLLAEPGLRGGRISLVSGSSVGSLGSAWTVRASYLQFWAGAPQRKHAGVEVQILPLLGIGGRIGAFRPLGTEKGDRRILIIGDISILL